MFRCRYSSSVAGGGSFELEIWLFACGAGSTGGGSEGSGAIGGGGCIAEPELTPEGAGLGPAAFAASPSSAGAVSVLLAELCAFSSLQAASRSAAPAAKRVLAVGTTASRVIEARTANARPARAVPLRFGRVENRLERGLSGVGFRPPVDRLRQRKKSGKIRCGPAAYIGDVLGMFAKWPNRPLLSH